MQRKILQQAISWSWVVFFLGSVEICVAKDGASELSAEQLYWEGVRAWEGWGGMVDTKKAAEFYEAAVLKGEPKSRAWKIRREKNLALGDQAKIKKILDEFSEIRIELLRLAEKGDREAEYESVITSLDLDPTGSLGKEIQILQKKADEGDLRAIRNLGVAYNDGKAVPPDPKKAFAFYQKASSGGSSWAMNATAWFYLEGKGVTKDATRAYELYLQSALQGNENGQSQVGWMLREGVGTQKNLPESFRWLQQAVERGHVGAMEHLGWNYEQGLGVSADPGKAFELYKQSAEQGNAGARVQMGRCLWNGIGIGRDRKEALACFEKAAAEGNPRGLAWLGYCHDTGQEVPRDLVKAKEAYQKAAEKGELSAMEWMGSFYENGRGGSKDLKEAARWYEKGAERENLACLRGLLRATWPTSKDPLEKERWKAWFSRTPEGKYPYLKTTREKGGRVLQTAIRTLRSPEGAEISLIGVCHLGEKDYYQDIQMRLDGMPLVFYEGLGLPDFFGQKPMTQSERSKWTVECGKALADLVVEYRKATGQWPGAFSDLVGSAGRLGLPKFYVQKMEQNGWQKPWSFDFSKDPPCVFSQNPQGGEIRVPVRIVAKDEARRMANQTSSKGGRQVVAGRSQGLGDVMQDFAKIMGLTYQFDQLDYNRPTFLNCDKPTEDVLPNLATKTEGAENEAGPISKMIDSANQPALPLALATLQLLPNAGEMMRSMMIGQFSSDFSVANAMIYGDFQGGSQEMLNILFVRNDHLIRAIDKEIKKSPSGRFGVIYGALHLPEVEQILVEKMGMAPVETTWLTAIRQKHPSE